MWKRKCGLCNIHPARTFCEAHQECLCWNCDRSVHTANVFASRHMRRLLCSICQSLLPWKASDGRIGPVFSVCESCLVIKFNSGSDRNVSQVIDSRDGAEPPVVSSSTSSDSSSQEESSSSRSLKRSRNLEKINGCDVEITQKEKNQRL